MAQLPLADAERAADNVRGRDPVHHVRSLQRVAVQFTCCSIGVDVDQIARGKHRHGAKRSAPIARRDDRTLHAARAQAIDHFRVETVLEIVEEQLCRAWLHDRQTLPFGNAYRSAKAPASAINRALCLEKPLSGSRRFPK